MSGNKVRVTLFRHGRSDPGKAFIVPDSWPRFLEQAASKCDCPAITRIQTSDGAVIEQLEEILPGDKLFVVCASPTEGSPVEEPPQAAAPASEDPSPVPREARPTPRGEEEEFGDFALDRKREELLSLISDWTEDAATAPRTGPAFENVFPPLGDAKGQARPVAANGNQGAQAGFGSGHPPPLVI